MKWSKLYWDNLDLDTQEWHIAYYREAKERKAKALLDISNGFTKDTNPYAAIISTFIRLAYIESD